MTMSAMQTVAVLGASPKSERFSNQAVKLLAEYQHKVIPINPAFEQIEGWSCCPSLSAVTEPVDTLSLYMGADRLVEQLDAILALKPKRVLFNPGTESSVVQSALSQAGIPWLEGCTLVLLRNHQF